MHQRLLPSLLALALAAALALSPTPARAGRKAVKPKPAPSTQLTAEESNCQTYGLLVEAIAWKREALTP